MAVQRAPLPPDERGRGRDPSEGSISGLTNPGLMMIDYIRVYN